MDRTSSTTRWRSPCSPRRWPVSYTQTWTFAVVAVCSTTSVRQSTGDSEGSHALVGAEMARRHNIAPKIVHTIAAHHFEEEPQTVEAFLVAAADAISASRPGARRETTEDYIRRLSALEEVAGSFPGVERSFALQAGREIRILVTPEEVDEYAAHRLASDIVNKIEESLNYPGQIKVTVIRETRFVEYAR